MEDVATLHERVDMDTISEKEEINKPEVGMLFSSHEDGYQYYASYGRQEGFGVLKRSKKRGDDGLMKYFTIACSRTRKPQPTTNLCTSRLITKMECTAKIRLTLQSDGMFKVTTVNLEHNHTLSPGKVRHFRCNKKMDEHVKRRLILNDQAGIRVNKNFNSLVVEAGGYENLSFAEKDCRNYIEKARKLRLGEGDAEAISCYFARMQAKNSNFFYMMDLDEDGRVRNLFWADARSRATYEAFGDVVTFDTTYLTNKYDMPFAPFVGVNHHGQSMLLGCGLLSNEDIETFLWLFESWLTCMSWSSPKAIITDQCKAMQRAIERVFPNTRHRWCLWHIMKKIPEKLKGYAEYKAIKTDLKNVVYDSFTKDEFEEGWRGMIENYDLHENEWLRGLYDERHRWVPIYVKDTFWAGMSTTQRSESMNSFFDGYVHSKTSLKQFVEQYDNALRDKIEKENLAEYDSFKGMYECLSHYDIEKQFQRVYTNAKFKEFQEELRGKMYCEKYIIKEEGSICIYKVVEDVKIGDKSKDVAFNVYFNEVECEVKCTCLLFEFKGIICRHSILILTQRRVQEIPPTYILSRWRKGITRKYTFIKSSYDDLGVKPHAPSYGKMFNELMEVVAIAGDVEERCNIVISNMCQLKDQFLNDESLCGSNQSKPSPSVASPNCANDSNVVSNTCNRILSPLAVKPRGRPRSKRKESKLENVSRRKKKQPQKKDIVNEAPPTSSTPHIVNEIRTQETINLMANSASFLGGSYVFNPPIGTQESVNIMANSGNFLGGSYVVAPSASNQSQAHLTQAWRGGYSMGNLTLLENLSQGVRHAIHSNMNEQS